MINIDTQGAWLTGKLKKSGLWFIFHQVQEAIIIDMMVQMDNMEITSSTVRTKKGTKMVECGIQTCLTLIIPCLLQLEQSLIRLHQMQLNQLEGWIFKHSIIATCTGHQFKNLQNAKKGDVMRHLVQENSLIMIMLAPKDLSFHQDTKFTKKGIMSINELTYLLRI